MSKRTEPKSVPPLDERMVEAVTRRIAARIGPEWLPLLGQAERHGVSRATMFRRIRNARETVRRRKLSRKLVLFHVGDVDRVMERAAADYRPQAEQPRSADTSRFVAAASA